MTDNEHEIDESGDLMAELEGLFGSSGEYIEVGRIEDGRNGYYDSLILMGVW